MTMIAFNVQTDLNKIQHLLLKIQKDAWKLVHKEHFNGMNFVRNVTSHASIVLVDTIIIVQNALMGINKIQLTNLETPKNV